MMIRITQPALLPRPPRPPRRLGRSPR
jgi:hypothetical protein